MSIILIAFGKCHECLSLTQLDSAQPGLTWLSIAIESILALKFKRSPFCSNTFEFLELINITILVLRTIATLKKIIPSRKNYVRGGGGGG